MRAETWFEKSAGPRVHIAILGVVLIAVAAVAGEYSYRRPGQLLRVRLLRQLPERGLGAAPGGPGHGLPGHGLGCHGARMVRRSWAPERFRALPTLVLGVVAAGLGLVAANRLLEPLQQA